MYVLYCERPTIILLTHKSSMTGRQAQSISYVLLVIVRDTMSIGGEACSVITSHLRMRHEYLCKLCCSISLQNVLDAADNLLNAELFDSMWSNIHQVRWFCFIKLPLFTSLSFYSGFVVALLTYCYYWPELLPAIYL